MVIFDEKIKQLRKLEDFNKDYESKSFLSENSQSAVVVSDPGEDIESCLSDRLFIETIDIKNVKKMFEIFTISCSMKVTISVLTFDVDFLQLS